MSNHDMPTPGPMEFDNWFARLIEFNKRDDRYDELSPADWRGYFDDEYRPEEAWAEDGTYK